ncbi:glycohydrolase toxin TNT-related protein [Amycolatopsis sp. PS_44_ISF1]|uniref:glycohydrolase toxin TNT-related protein n=1 Tax=Amycolatopsis sp. PS_44_ISF1 TaxID=2974917 RepID=UPI0028E018CD|nr:glycohydrolase toxin TNT-related protein [Amycolatopsis sp. PS_44_ISF1]MDT8910468.1 glycohydrolase toxin TNT-related protein [Amycolatopsis sp. PS_44_ISF1]
MRYRVEAAERPDGLYATLEGRTFAAERSTTDGTLMLSLLPGDQDTPEGFDREHNGRPARVVLANEVPATFTLKTYCEYDDELFEVAPGERPELTLRWTQHDPVRAVQLGLTDFSVTVPAKQLTALWQARRDYNLEISHEAGIDQSRLLRAIGRTLRAVPGGWTRVGAQFRQVGDYSELEVRAIGDENGPVSVSLPAPPRLTSLFSLLRAAMYQPESGTWFQGTFTLDTEAQFDFDFDADQEPGWRLPPNDSGRPTSLPYAMELANFPRPPKQLPEWLAAKAELPLDLVFRQARVVDAHHEGERPVVNRPPVPPDQVRGVLDYLFRAPVALVRPVPQPDVFAPGAPPDVPQAFHTDGAWIWPAAVPHYLRKYGVPPEPELIEHIRAAGFRPPFVRELVRATAEADVLGQPRPPRSEADLPDEKALARVAREDEPGRPLRAAETLALLQQRLTESGVPASAYRIGANEVPVEDVWTLRRADNRWEVSRPPSTEPVSFPNLAGAARYLLGTLLMLPPRAPDESDQPADWPILPLRGEPPLSFYRGKRLIVLPAGTTVQRYGNETGNLVHSASSRFEETSLAPARERERQVYRVQRAVRVLTGVTAPWGPMPGGAVAYLLPRPIAQHVEAGALSRV